MRKALCKLSNEEKTYYPVNERAIMRMIDFYSR
jgi:hypothetical protein